jgi:5'-methylthioadenosine phosphorylase
MSFRHPLSKRVYHLKARPEQLSPKVLVAGDPDRIEIASSLLEDPVLVSRHRGFPVITGTYKGEKITLACHGIGAPSAAIVFEELVMLGAKIVIRAGTCGGLSPEAESGKIAVIEASAYENSGTLRQYFGEVSMPAYATPEVTLKIVEVLGEMGLEYHRGVALSHDAFHKVEENASRWGKLGIDFLEMESAALFTIGRYRGLKTGAMALIVDNMISGSELTEGREELELKMMKAGLEALRRLQI